MMAISPTCIVVHESVPAKTLKEFIAYAKANPTKLSYGSAGAGTMTNLSGELFKQLIGAPDITHIPVQGRGSGRRRSRRRPHPDDDAERRRAAAAIPRAAARSASWRSPPNKRLAAAPDIPTAIEAGLPGMVAANFNGLFAPAGVPKAIIEGAGRRDARGAWPTNEVQDTLIRSGFEPVTDSGPEAGQREVESESPAGRRSSRARTSRFSNGGIHDEPPRHPRSSALPHPPPHSRRPRAFAQAEFPEPADQARGAVLGRRRERHRRPAMGRRMRALARLGLCRELGGAGGTLGVMEVSAPTPDGHTARARQHQHHGAEHHDHEQRALRSQQGLRADRHLLASASTSIAVHPSVPAKNVKEFIAYVKANAGKLSYGSAGTGTMSHLSGELFKHLTGMTDVVHVPYKGAGPGIADLVSGHIPIMSPNITGQLLQLHQAGKIRILAINAQGAPEGARRTFRPPSSRACRTWSGSCSSASTHRRPRRRPRSTHCRQATKKAADNPEFEKIADHLGLRAGRRTPAPDAARTLHGRGVRALEAGGRRDRPQDRTDQDAAAAATRSCASLRSALRSTLLVEASGSSSTNQTKRGC